MERKILNLTQHEASVEQVRAGVVEPVNKKEIRDLLTFDSKPDIALIRTRAKKLVKAATGFNKVMIGGAPYLMSSLEKELKKRNKTFLYAFSERISEETILPNGTTRKSSTFRFEGWI